MIELVKSKGENMHYNLDYYNQTAGIDMSQNCNNFLSYIRGTTILDLGCGSGRDSNYFQKCGYKVTSVDPNPIAATYAKNKFNIKVLQSIPLDQRFDGIWACACFVHQPPGQLKKSLKELKKHLNAEGVIYLSLKYGNGTLEVDEQIYYLYNERLCTDIEQLGYQVKAVNKSEDNLKRTNSWIEYIIVKN